MQGKRLMEFLSHLSGYHITARWKAISIITEEGKEILRLWHVESDEKDKKQVTRFLESMYNTNQRKVFPLGYKLHFLFDVKDSIGIHGMDKAKKLFIDKLTLSRFIDPFEFQVLKGHIMRIKYQGAHWQIVYCRSNRREHLSNSFAA
jgi:hypothetical protein